jgi:hypothetical protein
MSETITTVLPVEAGENSTTTTKTSKGPRINKRFGKVLDFSRRSSKLVNKEDKTKVESLKTSKKREHKYYSFNKHGTIGCIIREPRLKKKCKEIIAANTELLKDLSVQLFGFEPKFQQTSNARKVTLLNLDNKAKNFWKKIDTVSTNHTNQHKQRVTENHVKVAWELLN